MDLQEFIRNALVEISTGVAGAQEEVRQLGGNVGTCRPKFYPKEASIVLDEHDREVSSVEFDILLAEADSADTKGGIGVFLGSVGIGTQGRLHDESATRSRISFSVPIVFPDGPVGSG